MNKKIKVLIIGLVILGTISVTYATEYKNMNLGNITIDIPKTYGNGEILNNSYTLFRNVSGNNIFSVAIFQEYDESFVKNIGFWVNSIKTQEKLNISDRPVLFLKEDNKFQGSITYIIFESAGKMVCVKFPQSKGLTDTGRHVVESTPPGTIGDTQFYNILNQSAKDYKKYIQQQDAVDYSYEEGYYDGYDDGYGDGRPRGIIATLFDYIGI